MKTKLTLMLVGVVLLCGCTYKDTYVITSNSTNVTGVYVAEDSWVRTPFGYQPRGIIQFPSPNGDVEVSVLENGSVEFDTSGVSGLNMYCHMENNTFAVCVSDDVTVM